MADRAALLAQAKKIQRQKLLERAKAIQKEKLMQANEPGENASPIYDTAEQLLETGASTVGKALDWAHVPQALNYVGGVTRTGLGAAVLPKVHAQDVLNALKGHPLSTADMMEREGVGPGKSLSDVLPGMYNKTGEGIRLQAGGWADPTLRGAAGFVGDVATDPLTYGTLGIAPAAKAGAKILSEMKYGSLPAKVLSAVPKITNPATEGLMPAGKAMYKAGFKPLDAVSEQFGKEPVSEIAWRYGMRGTNKQIAKQADAAITKLGAQRDAILNAIDAAGNSPDMARAMLPAKKMAYEFATSNVPEKEAMAQAMLKKISEYESRATIPELKIPASTETVASSLSDEFGNPVMMEKQLPERTIPGRPGPTAQQLQDMKATFSSQELGNNAFKENSSSYKKLSSKAGKQFGAGMKNELETLADQTSPGLGADLSRINADQGGLLTTGAAMDKEALKGANKNLITSVDPIVYTLGYGAGEKGHSGGMWSLLAKKAADLSKSTYGRTNTGRALYNLGDIPGMDAFLRRPNPWLGLYDDEKPNEEE